MAMKVIIGLGNPGRDYAHNRHNVGQMVLDELASRIRQDRIDVLVDRLVLRPDSEGTEVVPAGDFQEIRDLLQGGSTLADAVIPKTRPDRAEQLTQFGDS